MNKRVAPSVELEAAIERLLAEGLADAERLGEIGRLGARLAIQRAVEEEVDAFLGRTRYERTPEARGWRNGNRPRQVQTGEGELEIQVPQIRGAAEKFVAWSVVGSGRRCWWSPTGRPGRSGRSKSCGRIAIARGARCTAGGT